MSNLQPNCCLKFDFQKVDQHPGGKWLIHDTKRRKDNQLQSLMRDIMGSPEAINDEIRPYLFHVTCFITIYIYIYIHTYDIYML